MSEWFAAGLFWGWIIGIATVIGFVGYRAWRYGPQRIEWRGRGGIGMSEELWAWLEGDKWAPYTDQRPELSRPIKQMVLHADASPEWEMDAAALFELENGSYAVVVITGCSCWPQFGETAVYEARTARQAIEDAVKGSYAESRHALMNKWMEQGGASDER